MDTTENILLTTSEFNNQLQLFFLNHNLQSLFLIWVTGLYYIFHLYSKHTSLSLWFFTLKYKFCLCSNEFEKNIYILLFRLYFAFVISYGLHSQDEFIPIRHISNWYNQDQTSDSRSKYWHQLEKHKISGHEPCPQQDNQRRRHVCSLFRVSET